MKNSNIDKDWRFIFSIYKVALYKFRDLDNSGIFNVSEKELSDKLDEFIFNDLFINLSSKHNEKQLLLICEMAKAALITKLKLNCDWFINKFSTNAPPDLDYIKSNYLKLNNILKNIPAIQYILEEPEYLSYKEFGTAFSERFVEFYKSTKKDLISLKNYYL